MSNWSLYGATRLETLGITSGEGVTVTSGTSTAKGTYATIGTTGFNYSGFTLQLAAVSTARFRLDIAIGSSDQIIVSDLYADCTVGAGNIALDIPIPVPTGTAIKARVGAQASSQNLRAAVTGYGVDTPGFRRFRLLTNLSGFTGADPTTVALNGTSATAWQEVTSSTAVRVAALYLCPSNGGDAARTATRMAVDIATGAAASETTRATLLMGATGTNFVAHPHGPIWMPIPPSTRVAWRATCSAASTDSMGLAIAGLVP